MIPLTRRDKSETKVKWGHSLTADVGKGIGAAQHHEQLNNQLILHIHALKKNKSYTWLFNNIGFTIKGDIFYVGPNTKNKKKMFC